ASARVHPLSLHDALPISRPAGMSVERLPHITYQQLAKAQRDAVLVDLREKSVVTESEPTGGSGPVRRATSEAELTDLRSAFPARSEEHTSELQSRENLVC